MAKFILPDNSPQNKKRMVAASGAYVSPSQDTPILKKNGLANSTLVSLPITRNAQFAGSGASVAMTQPMFFSPLHTPQNWQIASRRREIMQWSRFYYMNEPKVAAGVDFYCFTSDNLVLMADGTEKFIKDVKEGDMIVAGDGSFREVLKTHKRYTEEDILKIKVGGFNREIKVTLGHEIPRVSQNNWIKSSLTTSSKYKKKERINKFGDVKLKSIYNDANSIEIGDRLFTPVSNLGEGRKDISEDMCYVLGAFVAEGSYYWYENKDKVKTPKGLRFSIHEDEINNFGKKIIDILEKTYNKSVKVYSQSDEKCIDIVLFDTELSKIFYKEVGRGSKTKKISEKFINQANKEQLLSFMAGYIDGDGCFDSHHGCQIRTSSDSLFSQISFIIEKLGLSFSVFKDEPKIRKVPNGCLSKTEIYSYNIRVPRRDCEIFKNYSIFYKELKAHHTKYREFLGLENRIYRAAISIVDDFYKGDVYDLTVEGEHSYVVNRVAVHNSNFSMNGFKLECKSKKILKFYERLAEKIDLSEKLNSISHEYFLLGDVFPFTEIECPNCGGSGRKGDGELCNHADGTFKSIKLMNPDYLDVKDNPLASNPEYYLVPDEELKLLVQRQEPRSIYENLPPGLIQAVSSGQPIRLSDRCISHLKHNASDYGTYGTSMLQRLFTVLAYKTKLMTANWIVAERLILPVRVVKVGDKDRPATDGDLQDIQNQLSAVANDPNLTIVTHHAFDYDWFGASGKIHNITQEIEQIGKEILDGLMLNQAILNGEMAGYSCISADTTTLCDSGFKNYWEIDPKKDKIACYNPDTKKIEYHLPYEKMVYDYEGEMVHFNTDKIDILVTPNHRMWSAKRDSNKYRFIKAEDIKPRAKFIGAVDGYEGEYQKSILIGEEEYSIYDFCKMVGYYVSEGWVSEEKRKNRTRKFTMVSIGQDVNGKARDDIENLFDDMFETHYENNTQVSVYKPDLSKYLKENFGSGAINKKLSSFVKNLTPECLEIVLEAMINGDGCDNKYFNRKSDHKTYYTSSYQLAEDFAEIAFKCGYVVKIREYNKKGSNKKYFNKRGYQYKTNHQQYVVYISKGFKGKTPTLCSKSKKYAGKEITREIYNDKVYCFSVPYELFVTMRNGIITIQGNSAQVGIEVLIRRLDNWRNKLKDWVETNIFKPVAMMQGFIDEKESQEAGKTIYLYPKLIWNDLQLRDKTNRIQTLMQMHDKGMVSAQTVLEEMDLDYDSEVEKIREEQVFAQANGMVAGMGGGDAMAGAPMGGGPIGGDLGGGIGGMPGMGTGMEGSSGMDGMPGGGASMAPVGDTSMGTAASGVLPKIGKRGSQNKKEEQQVPQSKMIQLTKLEQKMFRALTSMDVKQNLFAQYQVKVPGESRPYSIDFAYPQIGVGIECLHPETYVPTIDGAAMAKDIEVGQQLIGRNGNPVEIIKKYINKSKGHLLNIKAMGMDEIKITDNHPLLVCKPKRTRVKRREPKITRTREYYVPDDTIFVKANKVKKGDYLVIPKNRQISNQYNIIKEELDLRIYRGKSNNSHKLPDIVKLNEDFGWLMGIYAAEGCSSGIKNKTVSFSFNIDEVEYSDKVQYLLKKIFNLPSSVQIVVNDNCRKVSCCCTSLGKFLLDSFGHKAPNKKLPSWMYEVDVDCKESFLEAFCQGDGCIRPNGTNRYISSSKKLIIDVQALAFSIGKFAPMCVSRQPGKQLCFAEGKKEHISAGLWEMNTKPYECKNKIYREDDDYYYVPITSIKEEEYKGDVINFETKGEGNNNHTYLVCNVVTHNCDGAIWHEREDFQQRDLNRDQKLANVGWRVLRFNEDALNEHMDSVKDTIIQHIKDASKSKKKAESESLIKTASVIEENTLYEYCLSKGKIGCSRASIPYGQILYIGNIENG